MLGSKIFKIDEEDKITYINQISGVKWKRWKFFKDCSDSEKQQANLAYYPNTCILFDRDLETEDDSKIMSDYESFKKMLIKRNINYFVSWRSPHGYHILAPFHNIERHSVELQDEIRKVYIDMFGSDLAKASTKGVVSLMNRPHFKNGVIYPIIEEHFGAKNEISYEVIKIAEEKVKKKHEQKDIDELFSHDFKNYFETDEFFKYISNNVIPDSTERNNIVFPNLAVAAVKSGKTREEIENILKPIIQNNFPGKSYSEFEGWYKKAQKQEITDYNPFMINKWVKEYASFEKDIYDVSSIPVDLKDEIQKLSYDIFEKSKHEILKKIDDFLIRINELEHPILQKYFIGLIAYKIKVNKKELEKQIVDIQNKLKVVLKPVSVFEMMNEEIKDEEFIIDRILPKGKTILIGAKGGRGKSLFVLSLCLATKSAGKYLDSFDINFEPNILYYSLENGRNREVVRAKYLKPDILRDNKSKIEMVFTFDKDNLKFELEKCKEYDLIVLDSFRRFLSGSENDSEVTNRFYNDFLKPLSEMEKTIIIIHHLKKCKLSEMEGEDLLDAFRGSSDIVNQFDYVYLLDRGAENSSIDNKKLYFDLFVNMGVKNRDGSVMKDLCINVLKDDEVKKTSFKYVGNKKRFTQKDIIKSHILEIAADIEMDRKEILQKVKQQFTSYSDASILRFLDELINEGLLQKVKYGKYKAVIIN